MVDIVTFFLKGNWKTHNDKWILETLQKKKNGYFVEAGAWDGVRGSSTLVLERQYSWRGLLVEPGPEFVNAMRNRPNSTCVNVILSDRKGKERFVYFPGVMYGYSCTLENFLTHREKIRRAHWWKKLTYDIVEVETVPLGELLDRHNAPKLIDFMTLDIEGSERTVLENFPFDRYKFRCIAIEGPRCDALLQSKGYERVKNRFNLRAHWESYFVMKP